MYRARDCHINPQTNSKDYASCPRDTVIFSFRRFRRSIPELSRANVRYVPDRRKRIEFVRFVKGLINFRMNEKMMIGIYSKANVSNDTKICRLKVLRPPENEMGN